MSKKTFAVLHDDCCTISRGLPAAFLPINNHLFLTSVLFTTSL